MLYITLFIVISSPDQLVQPDSDGVELSNGMTEKIFVLCHSRVALNEALGQIVDKKTEGVVNRFETLQERTKVWFDWTKQMQ